LIEFESHLNKTLQYKTIDTKTKGIYKDITIQLI